MYKVIKKKYQLAKEATEKTHVDYNLQLPIQQLKNEIVDKLRLIQETRTQEIIPLSATLKYYYKIKKKTSPNLHFRTYSRSTQLTYPRIRIGYKYK